MTNQLSSIFFYEGYVGASPTVANLSKILSENGYMVNIYGTLNNYPEPGYLGDRVRIAYLPKGERKLQFLTKIGLKNLISLLQGLIYILMCIFQILQNDRYQSESDEKPTNIGVDLYGSVAALLVFYLFRQKFLFLSLELREPGKSNPIIYKLSRLALRKSEGIIIQDEDRCKSLAKMYEYQHPKVFYLSNSPLDTDSDSLGANTENYFRQKFNLSQEQYPCIVLQAGMIDDTVLSKPLAQAFASIDNGYALIFHDRFPKSPNDPYLNSLRTINSKNLFISTEPVPYNQVDKIFSSCTISLAFYKGHNDDYSQIAMASGKLAHSLKLGKPVLVNDLLSLRRLVEKYQFGIVIKDPCNSQEINSAIEEILENYETYCKKARLCFDSEFDFSKQTKPILSFMNSLLSEE